MTQKDETLKALDARIDGIEEKIKNLRADLKEAKRFRSQRERVLKLERAERFFDRYGHMEDKLKVAEQRLTQEKSPQ